MPVTIKVLSNRLPGLPGKFRSMAGQVTQRSAERVRDRAKQLVLVDTGETQGAIEAIKQGPFTWAVNSTRPSTDGSFDVPSYLEYKVQPYMRPALEEERGRFLDAIDAVIDKAVR